MARPATPIVLTSLERRHLQGMLKKPKLQQRHGQRARIILRIDEGASNLAIARELGVRPATVSKWRLRFESEGLEGLLDDYRPGRPPHAVDGASLRQRMLPLLDKTPPAGYATWNGRLLAEALGINAHRVWKELRLLGINLARRRSWCIS